MPQTTAMSADELTGIVAELQPLIGARIQRVDVVALREVVLELRVPGRTLRLLISARPGLGRLCLVGRRPARLVPPGQLQSLLRSRLNGRALVALTSEARTVELVTRTLALAVRIDGGKSAFELREPPKDLPTHLESRPIPDAFPRAEAAGAAYEVSAPLAREEALRVALRRSMRARRKKWARLKKNIEADARRLASFQDAGADGELLKTVLHRVSRGAREVEVVDWTTGQPRTLALDPARTPQQNLERMFARAKKAARGLPRVRARAAEVATRLEALDARLDALTTADEATLAAWSASWAEAREDEGRSGQGAKAGAKAHPLDKWSRRFTAKDGASIRVGKGAAANDRLTFSGAKGDDIWLHARGVTGAHVVLSRRRGTEVGPEALLDAAHLAVHYSTAKNEAKAEVIHTEVRHVKKTKGAPAGQVGIAKSKTMLVRMDSTRLARLFGRDGAP